MIRLIVLACLVYTAAAVDVAETEELLKADTKWFSGIIQFPDADGNVYDVDLTAAVDYDALAEIESDEGINEYWLYTRENPNEGQQLIINDDDSIRNSNFDPTKQTVFIAHGWRNTGSTEPNLSLRAAFLSKDDYNVICVDWSKVSLLDYISAALEVPNIGQRLGKFIKYLVEDFQLSYDNIHLVGFSLGGHVVGSAGRENDGKVARITALDPAGPLWNAHRSKLTSTDAVFVEAILTDGILSMITDCAQVEFYVNGGLIQPGCSSNACNHRRAWQYFNSTITNNHLVGKRCGNMILRLLNMCTGEELPMGNTELYKTATLGTYRVNTGETYPY